MNEDLTKLNTKGAAGVALFGVISVSLLAASPSSRESIQYPGSLIPVFMMIALFVLFTPRFSGGVRTPEYLACVIAGIVLPVVAARASEGNWLAVTAFSLPTLFGAFFFASKSRQREPQGKP